MHNDNGSSLYKPFSYTHVLYMTGDRLGQLLALFSLLPVFIMVAYATLALSRRDLHVCSLGLGQLLNEVLNYMLKNTIREPRPLHPLNTHHEHIPAWGMPSDHSQFIAFFAAYVTCYCRGSREGAVWITAAWVGSVVVIFSRVYLGYHTVRQVVVGAAVGAIVGMAWYALTFVYLRPACFARITTTPAARCLRVRDCSGVHDIVDEEYQATVRKPNVK